MNAQVVNFAEFKNINSKKDLSRTELLEKAPKTTYTNIKERVFENERSDTMNESSILTQIEMMNQNHLDFKNEMRERDKRTEERQIELEKRLREENQRAEERTNKIISEIKSSHEKIESNMKNYENIIRGIEKQNRNFNIANLIAIVTLILSFIGILYSNIN